MSLAQALSTYLNLNLLIMLGSVGLTVFLNVARLKSRVGLKLHYAVLTLVIAFTVLHPFLPSNEVFRPAMRVWSAHSLRDFGDEYSAPDQGGYLTIPTPLGTEVVAADRVSVTWAVLGSLLLFSGLIFIGRDLRTLYRIKKKSFLIHRIGTVRILINDEIRVPFSYWLPGQAIIVVPSELVGRHGDYQMAVAQELQHHRNGDTRWVYAMWGLRLVCVINPAVHWWSRALSEIQEFACDETLVDRKKVESQAYVRCLVETAQSAVEQKFVPVCATGLTFLNDRNLLHRRVDRMLNPSSLKKGRSISLAFMLFIAALMGTTALASKGLVQDRRVTLEQANAMALKAQSESGFPVVVNGLVLKQLNRFIGTPEGREYMRGALQRMETYRSTIAIYMQKYGIPAEIMAVPIVESGYKNLAPGENAQHGAGIWSIISSTGHNFGLRVGKNHEERLEIGPSTDAAMRLLQMNNLRFKDWYLSTLAYNMGEGGVQKGIDATGSRDVWTLIRNGYEGDKDYLPKVIAAILIMKNPETVQ